MDRSIRAGTTPSPVAISVVIFRFCLSVSAPLQRRFLHQRDLLAQGKHVIVPVAARIEPGESNLECRIFPSPCYPCGVVHDAQASESLDKVQFARVKLPEFMISLEQCMQLRCLFKLVTRQEHPKILHRRSSPRVVEIDNVKLVTGDQDISRMKISVKPKLTEWFCYFETVFHASKNQLSHALVCGV